MRGVVADCVKERVWFYVMALSIDTCPAGYTYFDRWSGWLRRILGGVVAWLMEPLLLGISRTGGWLGHGH